MSKKSKRAFWIGFDLGGTKMHATVYDAEFRPLGKERRKTKGHKGSEVGLERISNVIATAIDESNISRDEVAGIGVGSPGPLDLNAGVIQSAPNLGWENVPIRDYLEDAFGFPAVIANDVDIGVYGEYRFGAGQGARCLLGVFPGTGIGGGCIYEGKILRGKTNSCMEIGHMQAVADGPRCGCGRRGCLEAVAGRLVIASSAAAAAYRGDAPHLMEGSGTDLDNIRSRALSESIAAGDQVVEEIVRVAASHIGHVVGSVINLLAADIVVLGGGLVEAIPSLFVETIQQASLETVLPSFEESYHVVAAKLGDDATVLGAAAWAREVIGAKAVDE